MKESKMDPWICLVSLVVFIYYFFVVGGTVIYWNEGEMDDKAILYRADEVKGIEYSTIIYIGPLIFFLFFMLWLFRVELKDVSICILIIRLKQKLHFK